MEIDFQLIASYSKEPLFSKKKIKINYYYFFFYKGETNLLYLNYLKIV